MSDESGELTSADAPIIEAFMKRVTSDNCLSCPVTGTRILLTQWQISDRLCMLPVSGQHFHADLTSTMPVLSCRSPAEGVVFLLGRSDVWNPSTVVHRSLGPIGSS